MMVDLANAYVKKGYDVVLITGRLVVRNTKPLEEVRIEKIIRYKRNNIFSRLFTWSVAFIQLFFLVLLKFRHYQLLIVSTPPFAVFLPLFVRNNFDLLIYDIYPDILVETGYVRVGSLLHKWWRKANCKIFSKAGRIITITEGMKKVLYSYAGTKTVEVIPIWTDNTFLKPVPKHENKFVEKYQLLDNFIVMYSGNLGLTHCVEIIPELAKLTKNPKIRFVIIGEGEKKRLLENKISEYGVSNVLLLPRQPVDMLPFSLSAADLALVTLGQRASRLSVPSKTYNFMSAGAALLCISGTESELTFLVDTFNNGKAFEEDQIVQIAAFIEELSCNFDLLNRYKQNSLLAAQHFDKENVNRFIQTF
ncbi:MAG: glycosyltransferase family 4 protein [Bacteroidales bacterium]